MVYILSVGQFRLSEIDDERQMREKLPPVPCVVNRLRPICAFLSRGAIYGNRGLSVFCRFSIADNTPSSSLSYTFKFSQSFLSNVCGRFYRLKVRSTENTHDKILKIASRIGRTAKSTIIPDTCHRALLFEDSRAHKTVLTLR